MIRTFSYNPFGIFLEYLKERKKINLYDKLKIGKYIKKYEKKS